MTSNRPVDEPEPRWQQPDFAVPVESEPVAPAPMQPTAPVEGRLLLPEPPPSAFETIVVTLSRLIWPIAIVLAIFTRVGFVAVIIGAIVLSAVLGALKKNLRQRRRAIAQPSARRRPDDLR